MDLIDKLRIDFCSNCDTIGCGRDCEAFKEYVEEHICERTGY